MKYKDWLSFWLENTVKPTTKPRTYARYREIAAVHIAPRVGEKELNELTPLALQSLVTELLHHGNRQSGGGLSANTVNTVVTVLQYSLKTAYDFGEVKEYFADRIKRPKATETDVSCFSLAEQRKIEKAILGGKKDKLFGVVLCLYTGLRIGELLSLEWRDIDFAHGILTVSKSCHYAKTDGGRFERSTDPPKTSSSRRTIPLPKQMLAMLKDIKKRSESAYVISSYGKWGPEPISPRSYQRTFKLLLKKLNIPHKGFHALRHTFATRALECGMDVKTLSEILGHKSASVTLNRYVHSLIEHKQEMMNKVGKLLQ